MKKILLLIILSFCCFTVVNAELNIIDLNEKHIYEKPGITVETNYNLDNSFHLKATNLNDNYNCKGYVYFYEQKDGNTLIGANPFDFNFSENDNIKTVTFHNIAKKTLRAYAVLIDCYPIVEEDTTNDTPVTPTDNDSKGLPSWAYVFIFTCMGFGIIITFSIVVIVVKMSKKAKKVITSDSFYRIMSENMYSIQDVTGEYNNVIRATRAVNADNIVFEFFEFTDSSYIGEVMKLKEATIKNGNMSIPVFINVNGFSGESSQSGMVNGIYYYFLRKGDCLLFATCSEDKKKELKNILKKIY